MGSSDSLSPAVGEILRRFMEDRRQQGASEEDYRRLKAYLNDRISNRDPTKKRQLALLLVVARSYRFSSWVRQQGAAADLFFGRIVTLMSVLINLNGQAQPRNKGIQTVLAHSVLVFDLERQTLAEYRQQLVFDGTFHGFGLLFVELQIKQSKQTQLLFPSFSGTL